MAETTTTIVSPKNLEDSLKAVYNEIPAVSTTIDSTSTNNSVPTSKATYDAIEAAKVTIDTAITASATDDHVPSSKAVKAYIGSIPQFDKQIVDTLPATGEDNIIYLVPNTLSENENARVEYMWINNAWEKIGDTTVDLSDYQKKPNDPSVKLMSDDVSFSATQTAVSFQHAGVSKDGVVGNYKSAEIPHASSINAGVITSEMYTKLDSLSPITPMTDAEVTAMINRIKGVST